jgi:hypothetical protein
MRFAVLVLLLWSLSISFAQALIYDDPDLILRSSGTPGVLPFLRGDANSDGTVGIADAINILGYAYEGGDEPSCPDAADADDNGLVDLPDAMRILYWSFAGGQAPASPGPYFCGHDTSVDVLTCFDSSCR